MFIISFQVDLAYRLIWGGWVAPPQTSEGSLAPRLSEVGHPLPKHTVRGVSKDLRPQQVIREKEEEKRRIFCLETLMEHVSKFFENFL